MGLFRFVCSDCDMEWAKILRGEKKSDCPTCGKPGMRIYNPPNVPVVYETRDKYRGVKMRQDLMRQLVKRSHEHTLRHCADDIIAEHGIDAAKKAGLLNGNGSKKTTIDEK